MYTAMPMEWHLKNICSGAQDENALRNSVTKLGYAEPFVMWGHSRVFLMTRAPDRELIISGGRRKCDPGPPKQITLVNWYGQNEKYFGWFIREKMK